MGIDRLVADFHYDLTRRSKLLERLRAGFVREPRVLILDEATSELDVETEAKIQRNLGGLSCTRVVAAHRLSTVRGADLIVVLDDGQIVEAGTHDELVRLNGVYAGLVQWQGTSAPANGGYRVESV